MISIQQEFNVQTRGRGTIEISNSLREIVSSANIVSGLCHVFIHHTSASLILCENADPDVHVDLESFMSRLVPDGDPMFVHVAEGKDDMPAHIRSIITQAGLTLPIVNSRLALGTWQGVYLWEHRTSAHTRRITVTAQGAAN